MPLLTEAFVFVCVPKCYQYIDLFKCMVIAYVTMNIWSHVPGPVVLLSAGNELLLISSKRKVLQERRGDYQLPMVSTKLTRP